MNDLQAIGDALSPEPKAKVPYTKAEARQRAVTLLAVVSVIVLCAMYFAAGWLMGSRNEQGNLPKCEEDEVLYPKDDYKGPGGNVPSDYGCLHIDEI